MTQGFVEPLPGQGLDWTFADVKDGWHDFRVVGQGLAIFLTEGSEEGQLRVPEKWNLLCRTFLNGLLEP